MNRTTFRTFYKSYLSQYLIYLRLFQMKSDLPGPVFCIGRNKTGTTSLGRFLRDIGYKHLSINRQCKKFYQKGNFSLLYWISKRFDSFDDIPWNRLEIIEMNMKKFPNAKFILTDREPEEWVNSWIRFEQKRGNTIPKDFNKTEFIQTSLINHNERVFELAQRYNSSLLHLNISDSNKEERICEFLGIRKPEDILFPHLNKTK